MKQQYNFKEYMQNLIEWENKKSYFDLDSEERSILTAYYILQNLRDRSEFLYQCDGFSEIISSLLKAMITQNMDDKEDAFRLIDSIAQKYFENEISQMFDIEIEDISNYKKFEAGLIKITRPDNGEIDWVKS